MCSSAVRTMLLCPKPAAPSCLLLFFLSSLNFSLKSPLPPRPPPWTFLVPAGATIGQKYAIKWDWLRPLNGEKGSFRVALYQNLFFCTTKKVPDTKKRFPGTIQFVPGSECRRSGHGPPQIRKGAAFGGRLDNFTCTHHRPCVDVNEIAGTGSTARSGRVGRQDCTLGCCRSGK